MVNVILVRLIGKFPGQTEILKRKSRLGRSEWKFVYHLQVS